MGKSRYLIIMAKDPAAGRVKRRMTPPLSPEDAARLYRCFLEDTIQLARRIGGVTRGIAYAPSSSLGFFREIAPADFTLLPQPRGGLGTKLAFVFRRLFLDGAAAVCIMNSDGPDLPPAYLRRAFTALEDGAEVILGPNPDGGYYLVGLAGEADIFRGIPWSTSGVLEVTLERVSRAGLSYSLLPPWPDLDTIGDLEDAMGKWRSGEIRPPRRTYRLAREILGGDSTP